MATETKKATVRAQASGVTASLTDVLYLTLRRWPWIVASLAVCVGGALCYILRTPNVHTRSAELLIKDESSGKSAGMDDFGDFGLFQSNTNIANEISTLKSGDIMEEVVRRLNLDVNCYRDGRFHDVVAYGYDLPLSVDFAGFPDESTASFNLALSPDGGLSLTDMEIDGEEAPGTPTAALGDSIKAGPGFIVVRPAAAYTGGVSAELKVRKTPLSAARGSYAGRLGVAMSNDKGTVIRLTFSDESTQRADDVLNTLINVYNESWMRDKNQIAVSTSNFINDRLGVIEGELGNVDSDISSFKSEHLIPDVEAASSMYMTQNQSLSQQLLGLNNQLQMTRYVRSYLTAEGSRDQLLPANSGMENSEIQGQIAEYNDKLLQRNSLVAKSSEKNPLVQALDEELAAQRNAIVATVDNQIVALNSQVRSLQGSQAATTSKIASNPLQSKYLLSVERQQKVKESLYLFLLQKREENELSQAFTAYNTRIVNKPGAAGVPPVPNKRNILMIAVLLGLAVPFGINYLLETNNTRVRGRKDLEHLTLPFLGEIPVAPEARTVGKDGVENTDTNVLVVKEGQRDIVNEAFRVLRTNVEFMKASTSGADVIAVTSFNPGSGKSFITVNLAVAMALKGKKVLVIDGDMRHGSTSAYAGSPVKGLSNYLSSPGQAVGGDIVSGFGAPTLDMLPVGTVPPNPTELLESPRFAELIAELRPRYDYILIDCPPVEVVADAQIIDAQADRTLFIIRSGLLDRSMLPELERLYGEKKYRNLAVILNGTEVSGGRYGYSHGYRYGYGYSYGQGGGKKK